MLYTIHYRNLKRNLMLSATFHDLEDAQLWWDTIYYLRNDYADLGPRPKAAS